MAPDAFIYVSSKSHTSHSIHGCGQYDGTQERSTPVQPAGEYSIARTTT